ncbi:MAG TPA: type II secretion system protein [Chthoniobacterales bacterium]|nr:type II secretion system protein [Chthoniobacterales bacterium]
MNGLFAEVWGAHAPRVQARRLAERTFSGTGHRLAEDGFGEAPKPAREARALPRRASIRAFTIVEVIVVMAIILVLAGLILATSGYVQKKGARSRAEAEIAAISAALENYKADHGIYPRDARTDALKSRAPDPTAYAPASLYLYDQLAGATGGSRTPIGKSYFSFKPNQLNPPDPNQNVTFVRDPFGNSYGYSTAHQVNSADGYNPTFDLWSTANAEPATDQTQWIKNW